MWTVAMCTCDRQWACVRVGDVCYFYGYLRGWPSSHAFQCYMHKCNFFVSWYMCVSVPLAFFLSSSNSDYLVNNKRLQITFLYPNCRHKEAFRHRAKQCRPEIERCRKWFCIPILSHSRVAVPIPMPSATHFHSHSHRIFKKIQVPSLKVPASHNQMRALIIHDGIRPCEQCYAQNNNSVHCRLTVHVYCTAECCGYRSKWDPVLSFMFKIH